MFVNHTFTMECFADILLPLDGLLYCDNIGYVYEDIYGIEERENEIYAKDRNKIGLICIRSIMKLGLRSPSGGTLFDLIYLQPIFTDL